MRGSKAFVKLKHGYCLDTESGADRPAAAVGATGTTIAMVTNGGRPARFGPDWVGRLSDGLRDAFFGVLSRGSRAGCLVHREDLWDADVGAQRAGLDWRRLGSRCALFPAMDSGLECCDPYGRLLCRGLVVNEFEAQPSGVGSEGRATDCR